MHVSWNRRTTGCSQKLCLQNGEEKKKIYFPDTETTFSPAEPSQFLWELPSDSSSDVSVCKREGLALACLAQLLGALSCEFDSQAGHIPRLQVQSPAGARRRRQQCFSLSLFLSPSLSPPTTHPHLLSLKAMKKCPWVRIF